MKNPSLSGRALAMALLGAVQTIVLPTSVPADILLERGDNAPGTGGTFTDFAAPILNERGDIMFAGRHQRPGGFPVDGLWAGAPGQLRLVALDASPAPGTAENFIGFSGFHLNDAGTVAFLADLDSTNIFRNTGFWAGAPGNLSLVAREGASAPGLPPGVTLSQLLDATLNNTGSVAIRAFLEPTFDQAIWSGRPGALNLIAGAGSPAVGVPGIFRSFGRVSLNHRDRVAFRGRSTEALGGGNVRLHEGIWIGEAGSLSLVTRFGAGAPGTGNGVLFAPNFGDPVQNDAGGLAFFAGLEAGGVTFDNDTGLWAGMPGDLKLVAREGDRAPGTAAGVVFSEFERNNHRLDEAGSVAFLASLRGPGVDATNDKGIWAGTPGNATLVVRAGSAAPGTTGGVVFETLGAFGLNSDFEFNEGGELAFFGTLSGPGVNGGNRTGIWAGPPGALRLVARGGIEADLGRDGIQTISSVILFADAPEVDEGRSPLSNKGQLAMVLGFSGAPGAIVSSPFGRLSRRNDVLTSFPPGQRFWARLNNSRWRLLNGASPIRLATGRMDGNLRDEVVADFGAPLGLWVLRNRANWRKLHGSATQALALGRLDAGRQADVLAGFAPPLGLWARMNDSAWVKLNGNSPELLATADMDDNGQDEVLADFGPGLGLWVYHNNTSWRKLHGSSPVSMTGADLDSDGRDEVVVNFGAPLGVWARFNDTSWVKLNGLAGESLVAADMDGNGIDEVAVDFGANGLWVWRNNAAWQKLHGVSPEVLTAADVDSNGKEEIVVDFGAPLGLWMRINDLSWAKLNGLSPQAMGSGNIDSN